MAASRPHVLAAARDAGVVVREGLGDGLGGGSTIHLIRRAHDGSVLTIPVYPATYDAAVHLIRSLNA